MEESKKCLRLIRTTRNIFVVASQALTSLPIFLLILYPFAGLSIKYFHRNLREVLPLLELIHSRNFIILILAFIALRMLWIYSMNKRTTFELTDDQLIAVDRFMNDEQRTLSLVNAGEVYQSANIFQKIFGIGNILVSCKDLGSGEDMVLKNVEDPVNAFKQISAQVAYMKNNIKVSDTRA